MLLARVGGEVVRLLLPALDVDEELPLVAADAELRDLASVGAGDPEVALGRRGLESLTVAVGSCGHCDHSDLHARR